MESKDGYFGQYGGRFVSSKLSAVLQEIENKFKESIQDENFKKELEELQKNFIGRPTPLLYAKNLTEHLNGAKIYFKLECLANTGAHKINNAVGQALLAKRMGKKRVIAETGAGQHGIATASICAKLGLDCEIYMGKIDMERQRPNVFWMEMFGAKVVPVDKGSQTLTDAVDEAFRVWEENPEDTYYLIGSALGPSPYPDMVREFQSIIGKEVKEQFLNQEKSLPDIIIACVGGGSNSIGIFSDFLGNPEVKLIGVEAGGNGENIGEHASRMCTKAASIGCIQGYKSYFLHKDNNLLPTHSISAGLDYAGIGPQLAFLGETGRIKFTKAMDNEAINAIKLTAKYEGFIPALESSHAIAEAIKIAPTLTQNKKIVVNISGRGDKDIFITSKVIAPEEWSKFLLEEIERINNK